MRQYISLSSQFNTFHYDALLYKRMLRQLGVKNVSLSRLNGLSNQPQVVTFPADSVDIEVLKISFSRLPEFSDGRSIIIYDKGW